MMMSADGGQSSQLASPDDVRRRRLLRVGRQLVDARSQKLSSGEVGQRSMAVWNVASEQDGERGRTEKQVFYIMQSRLSISVSGHQLPQDGATLRAVLLRAVFLRPTTGLCQLHVSGCQQSPACPKTLH